MTNLMFCYDFIFRFVLISSDLFLGRVEYESVFPWPFSCFLSRILAIISA